MSSPTISAQSSNLGGMLRFIGIFSVIAFATLGFLTVFDVLSFEDFGQLSIRLAMIACIAGAASIAIWALLLRRR